MNTRVGLWTCVIALPWLLPAAVQGSISARDYRASLQDTQWNVLGNAVACRLKHEIPSYGEAEFTRMAGGALTLQVHVRRVPAKQGRARLDSVPPPWSHGARQRLLAQVTYRDQATAFHFDAPLARRVLAELEQGMVPTLAYQDWSEPRRRVRVALSAVNFRSALEKFLECTGDLLPHSLEQMRDTRISFASGAETLPPQARRRLDEVAQYLKLHPQVRAARVAGYTDAVGAPRRNDLLSKRRAESVERYLREAGVPESKIRLRFFGEKQPLASNEDAAGRARNRRVEVRLLR